MPRLTREIVAAAAVLLVAIVASASAFAAAPPPPVEPAPSAPRPLAYPTTVFAPGSRSASVSDGDITATITMTRMPEVDPDVDVPVLTVTVAGKQVLAAPGIESDTDDPAAVASIAEMDPANGHKEVYFSSFSGGCCSSVIVAEEVGDHWVSLPIGDFQGDGRYLQDLDGDGVAEIVAVDGNFINRFDCTACSAAPRVIYSVKAGEVADLTGEPRFLGAHRAWLKTLEESVDPADQWKSPGFLAGWLGEKIRVGEGAAGWQAIAAHWDAAHDPGEEVCPTGDDIGACAPKDRKVLKFPDRLRLFLAASGYKF